jgi:peroxiredoxin Q/BCP
VALAYGLVGNARGMPKRWTFVIGPDGKILHIDKNVSPKTHGADCAAKLAELGIAASEQ